MNREDVEKLSTAAKGKINLLNSNFGKYFMRAIMAGFFIDVAMIYSNVVGNVFSKTFPEWGKFLGALVFSIAVLLIVMVGGELFTGNNLVMAFGAYDKRIMERRGQGLGNQLHRQLCGMPDPGSDLCWCRSVRYSRLLCGTYKRKTQYSGRTDVFPCGAL